MSVGPQDFELGEGNENHPRSGPHESVEASKSVGELGGEDSLTCESDQPGCGREGEQGVLFGEETLDGLGVQAFEGNSAARKKPASIRPRQIRRILESQRYKCAYTGDDLTPDLTSADHMTPFARGGSHGPENIALILQHVNYAKGSMTLEEFVTMCRKVVAIFGLDGPVMLKR